MTKDLLNKKSFDRRRVLQGIADRSSAILRVMQAWDLTARP